MRTATFASTPTGCRPNTNGCSPSSRVVVGVSWDTCTTNVTPADARIGWAEVVGVYRVAISNNRIVAVDESSVSYRFTPTGSQQSVTRTVPGNEFVRGFLQHTLPRDFHRLRYYGFASQNSKLSMGWVRMLVWFYRGWCYLMAKQTPPEPIEKPAVRCHECGGEMHLVAITDGSGALLYNHPLPYLDSG